MGRVTKLKKARRQAASLNFGIRKINIGNKENIKTHSILQAISTNSEVNRSEDHPEEDKALLLNKHFTGRRVIDLQFFITNLVEFSSHGPYDCGLKCIKFVTEQRKGLISKFTLQCQMCNKIFTLYNLPPCNNDMDINHSLVSGVISIGSGVAHLRTITASMGLPPMHRSLYQSVHNDICEWMERTALHSMKEAAKEEAEYAVRIGSVSNTGIPMITVVADGCWSKRSYGTNYNALSGVAAVVGFHTGKVLDVGVKCKYCLVCSRATNKGASPPQHKCFKNYEGSSTGMESTTILECFEKSIGTHGLIYNKLISDGDSSTYKKILNAQPYKDITVEKIECKNHLLRNYRKGVMNITTDTQHPLHLRKIVKDRFLRLVKGIECAIRFRKNENVSFDGKVLNLSNDILNCPRHVFGDHSQCAEYFCKKIIETNHMADLASCYILTRIEELNEKMSHHSRSLIYDVTSNVVEHYNSQVAKFVGGKRINYSLRRSYRGRCAGAVVSFNTRRVHTALHEVIFGKKPNKFISRLEKDNISNLRRRRKIKYYSKPVLKDADYGENCHKPDMTPDIFEKARGDFLEKLRLSVTERRQLEQKTVLQSGSALWLGTRKKLLTASNFGKVCKRRMNISCAPLVKAILYTNLNNVPSIRHGLNNEKEALRQLSVETGKTIEPCGLFIDEEYNFLGASPDGQYDGGIVEIKCPSSIFKKKIEEGLSLHAFWKQDSNGIFQINRKHDWHFQIQGQLHITKHRRCMLGIYTGSAPMKVEYIERDDQFWKEEMENKLKCFYYDCLVPELVDPRYTRSMPIRDPPRILASMEVKNESRKRKAK